MNTLVTPTAAAVAVVCDHARIAILTNGYCKTYTWSIRQAHTGTPLSECAVDLAGALLIAVHGTPRHIGDDPLTRAAEMAVAAEAGAISLANWCSRPGNGKAQALALLADTAARLRGGDN